MSVALIRRAMCGAVAAALLLSACTTSTEQAGPAGDDTARSTDPVPDPDVVYVYDALGRLRAVTVPDGDTAEYHYDAVGNRLGVDRYPSDDPSVIEVVPARGAPGTEITLHGTGFAPDPGGNDVEFAGRPATVTAAGTFELTVVVPEGAVSGPVTVSTPHGSAASDEPFDVIEAHAPVVTAVHPRLIGPWDEVTIEGEGFTGDPLLDHVVVGDTTYATVESASPTKLVVTVPPTATSGRVSVATPDGTGHSADEVFVTPWTQDVAIGTSARGVVGEPTTVSIDEPGGAALVAFVGTAGQLLTLRTEGGDDRLGCGELQFRVSGPGGVELARDATLTDWCGEGTDRAVRLPADGTYALVAASRRGRHAGVVTLVLEDAGGAPEDDVTPAEDDDGGAPAPRAPTGGVLDGSDLLPIDLTSGKPVFAHTDLVVDDVVPIEVTRTFEPITRRPAFPIHRRGFGIGSSWELDLELRLSPARQYADLVLPDGVAEIPFERVTPGADEESAVFRTQVQAASLPDAHISWNGNGWDLALEGGTTLVFAARTQAPLVAVRDERGNTLTIERGEPTAGRPGPITAIVSPSGRWVRFSHDDDRRIVEATDHLGTRITYRYDDEGLLAAVTSSDGGELGYRYDDRRRVVAVTGDDGVVLIANEYDDEGQVVEQTLDDGSAFRFSYTSGEETYEVEGADDVVIEAMAAAEVVDPAGTTRRVTFQSGYWMSDTLAAGSDNEQTVTVERDPDSGLVTSMTEPDGRRVDYRYDDAGNLVALALAAGDADDVLTRLAYESDSPRLASVTDPGGLRTSFGYDDAGNLVTETDPDGATTSYGYDDRGRVVAVTSPDGHTVTVDHELTHRLSVTDSSGHTSEIFHDAAGRMVAATDPGGHVTRYGYDADHRLSTITDPLGGATHFAYHHHGALTELRDATGNVTRYATDVDDDLVTVTRTDSARASSRLVYDDLGQLVEHVDRRGVRTTLDYDDAGQVVTVAYGVDEDGEPESTIGYAYDAVGRLVRVDDSAYGRIQLSYDGALLASEETPAGEVVYDHDSSGNLVSVVLPDGTRTRYEYDDAGRLTSVATGELTATMTHDELGRVAELRLPNGVVVYYGFDHQGLVDTIRYGTDHAALGSLAYRYDHSGRRVAAAGSFATTELPPTSEEATYDRNRLVGLNGADLVYDDAGNLVDDGTSTYTWDARGQLVAVEGPVSAEFGYDPFGRRTHATVDGVTSTYLYDGVNVAQRVHDGSISTYLAGPGRDQIFARTDGQRTDTYLTDALGSVVGLAGPDGALVATYGYEAFGRPTVGGDDGSNPFAFTGRELDGTGLYYHRNRYYHPGQGRFISEDPLEFEAGDPTLYAYVHNDPVNLVDPDGLQALNPACGVAMGESMAHVSRSFADFAEIMDPDRGPDPFSDEARIQLDHMYRQTWDVFWWYLASCGASVVPGAGGVLGSGLSSFGRTLPRVARPATTWTRPGGRPMPATRTGPGTRPPRGPVTGQPGRARCSFAADTGVLLADGRTVPIHEVAVGDRILARDPTTGEEGPRPVTAVMEHEDTLVDLEVGGERVTTTADHPFWSETAQGWRTAATLAGGDRLLTASGASARVDGLTSVSPRRARAYNLTVAGLHSYFVSVGDQHVLVHNTCPPGRAGPGNQLVPYNPDVALSQLTRGLDATASQLIRFVTAQGWRRVQTPTGPIKFVDANGIVRLTIKQGSPRAPGSGSPHVEMRNARGERIDAFGFQVTRRSPGNHTPIVWDLP